MSPRKPREVLVKTVFSKVRKLDTAIYKQADKSLSRLIKGCPTFYDCFRMGFLQGMKYERRQRGYR